MWFCARRTWVLGLLGTTACIGDIDPGHLANFATRIERIASIAPIRLQDYPGWTYAEWDREDPFLIQLNGEAFAELYSLTGQEDNAWGVPTSRTLARHLTFPHGPAVMGNYAVLGDTLVAPSSASHDSYMAALFSLAPETRGDCEYLETPAEILGLMTTGQVLATDHGPQGSFVAFATSFPAGIAIYDAIEPSEPVFLQHAADPSFEDIFGGTLFRIGTTVHGIGVSRSATVVPFTIDDLGRGTVAIGESIALGDVDDYKRPAPQYRGDVARVGDGVALVTNAGRLLYSLDIADPMRPMLLGAAAGLSRGEDIFVDHERRLAVVANDTNGVALFDVSDPANPVLLNRVVENQTRSLSGPFPFLYSGGGNIEVYEVFSPSSQR